MNWPSSKATRVLAALLRIGWVVKRQSGSHRVLHRSGRSDYVFAFHDSAAAPPIASDRKCWRELLSIQALSQKTCNHHSLQTPPNSCKKLTKRPLFARAPSGALEQSTLDGGTPLARPFYHTEQAACLGFRRPVKPFCALF